MGGGDLNMKKSWHPVLISNQERVWKVEKKKAEEDKKLKQLMKERDEERQLADLQRMQEEQTGKKKVDKLDWMYATPASGGGIKGDELEDYLLGKRRVDQILKGDEEKAVAAAKSETIALQNANTARDTAAKIREDPLLAIKQQEQAALAALRANPQRLRELQEKAGMKEDKKEMKRKEKEERRRRKEERRAARDEGGARSRSRSRSPVGRRSDERGGGRYDDRRGGERNSRDRSRERVRDDGRRDRDRDGRDRSRDYDHRPSSSSYRSRDRSPPSRYDDRHHHSSSSSHRREPYPLAHPSSSRPSNRPSADSFNHSHPSSSSSHPHSRPPPPSTSSSSAPTSTADLQAQRAARLAAMSTNASSHDAARTVRLAAIRQAETAAAEAELAERERVRKSGVKAEALKGLEKEVYFGKEQTLEGRLREGGRRVVGLD